MVTVLAGTYTIGCDPDVHSCSGNDSIHDVTLTYDYQIDLFETTNQQYQACVDAEACTAPSSNDSFTHSPYFGNPDFDNFPVINITWDQAATYCSWAGKRLPTEAEWEIAARGDDQRIYPWGNDLPTCALANYNWCQEDVTEVGSYPTGVSPSGAFDMAGNVQEWCQDWYSPYSGEPETNPVGPETGSDKVVRGGTFKDNEIILNVFLRSSIEPTRDKVYTGFRCAKTEE